MEPRSTIITSTGHRSVRYEAPVCRYVLLDCVTESARRLVPTRGGAQPYPWTRPLLTTEWVLAEFLAFYSAAGAVTRQRAAEKTRQILQDPRIHVLSPSQAMFLDGLALYASRLDKEYSLTDCISMHVMHREGLTDVLTNDHHFTQEGFRILFL